MPVFVVLAIKDPAAVEAAVKQAFPADSLKTGPYHWLVAGKGTTQDIAQALGFNAQRGIQGVVMGTVGHFGYAPTNIWEWIKAKAEAFPVG